MILAEFDTDKNAIINPWDAIKNEAKIIGEMPKVAVTCFECKTFDRLVELLKGEKITATKNAQGEWPIYRVKYKGKELAIYMTDMGAAGAAGQLEEIYALGVEKVIVYGSCGALEKGIEDCAIIIPNAAVRDEGLSYHYAPPSDEMAVNPKYTEDFIKVLEEADIKYRIGKTWTTDAFYRETRAKMERRKEQGCICVDMECSALAAVAQFRGKELFQFFYAADCLDGEAWDRRSLSDEVKFTEKDMYGCLALELAVRI